MQYNNVAIRAEGILSFKVHDGDLIATAEDLSTVNVEYNEETGPTLECSSCHRELTEYSKGYVDDQDNDSCPDVTPRRLHTAVEAPLSWLNSASINPDPDDNSLTLTVSVGDPRGAFYLYIRKAPDGRILLDVPHPSNPGLHMPLTEIVPGAYRVGS